MRSVSPRRSSCMNVWVLRSPAPGPTTSNKPALPYATYREAVSVVRLCSMLFSRLTEFQHVSHGVEARFRVCSELRSPHRALGKGAPREGTVDHFDLFTLGVEDQAMLSDDRPAAQGVYSYLALRMRCDELDVVAGELRRELPGHLAEEVYPNAHVRGEHDGYVLCGFFDLRALLLIEPCGPDDRRLTVGEVIYCGLGGGELDEDLGFLGRVFGQDDAELSHTAELAE